MPINNDHQVWFLYMGDGYISNGDPYVGYTYVWPVRGGQ